MKTITKYVTDDGVEFKSALECMVYESHVKAIKQIMSQLKPRPKTINFINGQGYLQHDDNINVHEIKEQLESYAKEFYLNRNLPDFILAAFGRLDRIDNKNREWGQLFYKLNPQEAKYVKLQNNIEYQRTS